MKRFTLPLVGLALIGMTIGVVRSHSSVSAPTSSAPLTQPTSASPGRVAAEGRVVAYPGAEVVVGTDFAGTVRRLLVKEKSTVKKGDLLAEMNADAEKAALAESQARVKEAEADIRLAEYEKARAEKLLAGKVGTRQALDKAERDLDTATARRATSLAEVKRLAAVVAKSRIVAPISGVVLVKHLEEGETVDRGARIATLADLSRVRVEAEVDEFDSGRITLGDAVTVRAEGGKEAWAGRVEEIPDSVAPRKMKPQDPGKPSDTRVLLVKVALSQPTPLKLGRRVEIEIRPASK